MSIFHHADFDCHEQVLFCHDPESGLRAIIAIHSTALGPAAGGCRMHPYASETAALTDVLRLSKGMSYKNAVAGLPLGGGKSVIIADPDSPDKADLLRAFSRHIQCLNGRYWTAIDVGVGPHDADIMAEECDYIFARASQYEAGFNPSSFTALGGFAGIRAAVASRFGTADLTGRRVAVQGLGATGFALCQHLKEAGAELIVADIRPDLVRDAIDAFGAVAADPSMIHAADADVFAPCAMGAVLTETSIPELRASIICGLANNQLATPEDGKMLAAREIVYVPDYVVNAGGMMGASTVIFDTPSRPKSIARIDGLYDTIKQILDQAVKQNRPSSDIADEIARDKIARAS